MATGAPEITNLKPLLEVIRGEYEDMPTLRLTCAQAQRLWGLDRSTSARALQALVDVKFLSRASDGRYHRSDGGLLDSAVE